jgi:diguanylate cyclase (GGDEF)-like protein
MTGLANRRSFVHGLERALDRTRRVGESTAVLLFALNRFKAINDEHGHHAGDAVLAAFASALRRNVLGRDVVGRLGGDEFAVVLHAIRTPQDAVVVTERILTDLLEPVAVRGHRLTVLTSVGIALARPDDDTALVLHRADQAMYLAKRESPSASSWRVDLDDDGSPAASAPSGSGSSSGSLGSSSGAPTRSR